MKKVFILCFDALVVLDDFREARKSALRSEVILFSVKRFLLRELSRQNANLRGR